MPTQILKRALLITTIVATSAFAYVTLICCALGAHPLAAPYYAIELLSKPL